MDAGPPTEPLDPGSVTGDGLLVGRYRLGDLLGRGGMAEVFAAHDEVLHREVAIKVLTPGTVGPDSARQQEEARLLASLSHPHLVTVHDAHLSEPEFFVMQLVPGPSLFRQLHDHGPLSPHVVAELGAQLADALAYVHGRGLVHRDVKPGNVLLAHALTGPQDAVDAKLTDFGIARLESAARLTATGMVLGTAAYLSPEQATGAGVGAASDVYSLGLVLLESLTGRLAYPGNAMESAVARLHRPPEISYAVPAPLADLLRAMTAQEAGARPSAAEVATALRGLRFDTSPAPEVPTLAKAPLPAGGSPATSVLPTEPTWPPSVGAGGVVSGASTTRETRETREAGAVPPARAVRASRGRLLAALAVVAVLVVLALVVPRVMASSSGVTYPVVGGQLGEHLGDLQKAVAP